MLIPHSKSYKYEHEHEHEKVYQFYNSATHKERIRTQKKSLTVRPICANVELYVVLLTHTLPISASMDWISLLRIANYSVAIPNLFEALTLDFSKWSIYDLNALQSKVVFGG